MTTPIPELDSGSLAYGKVIARFGQTQLDSPDVGDAPDIVPTAGTVTLTPLGGQGDFVGDTYVFDKSFVVPLIDGVMSTRVGEPGVKVHVGPWRATFALVGAAFPTTDFVVTAEHTTEAPLNILKSAPPPGGEVLTPSQYSVLDARIDALEEAPGGGGLIVVNNGDGTLTLSGSNVVNNGDGTLTLL